MWIHYCRTDRSLLSVGHGETCTWCDAHEDESCAVALDEGLLQGQAKSVRKSAPLLAQERPRAAAAFLSQR